MQKGTRNYRHIRQYCFPKEDYMKKKCGLITFVLFMACAMVFAQGAKETTGAEKVVLRMGDNIPDRATGWGAVIERINTDFIAEHPEVEIKTESYQDQAWQEKVKIYATANQLPDVMKYWSFSTLLQPLVDGNFVEPLDMSTFQQYGYMPGALEGNVYNGKLYGIPVSADLWVIYVNKDLFLQAGVPLPKTWEDIVASVPKFKAKGIVPMVTDGKDGWPLCEMFDNIQQRVSGSFQPVADALTRKARYTDKNFLDTARYIQNLVKAGVFQSDLVTSDYGASRNLFGQERAAMYMMGSWEMGLATDPNFSDTFKNNLDVIKFPVIAGGKGQADDLLAWYGGNYIINAKTKHKDLTLAYLEYYAKVFPDYAWETQATFPAQKVNARDDDTIVARNLLKIAAEATTTSGTPGLDRSTAAFKETHQDLMRRLMSNIITPEDFCAQLDAADEKAAN
jgi:raffinose/stachyose/melibiose transport system substrate-binding protein